MAALPLERVSKILFAVAADVRRLRLKLKRPTNAEI